MNAVPPGPGDVLADRLTSAGRTLARGGTADRVADALRDLVLTGDLRPGMRLREDAVSGLLGVSRNTLREAFRLLSRERLLQHELHRGVFVRALTAADVSDVYRVRRLLEVAAVRADPVPGALAGVDAAVAEGRAAAAAGDWAQVGTADVRFHRALVALAGSLRMEEAMSSLLAELRLAFVAVPDARALHEPYLPDNTRIAALLGAGERDEAAALLGSYLERAERQVLAALQGVADR